MFTKQKQIYKNKRIAKIESIGRRGESKVAENRKKTKYKSQNVFSFLVKATVKRTYIVLVVFVVFVVL
jgi:hypothetical protein